MTQGPAERFPDALVDEIKDGVPISDVISGYVNWDHRKSRPSCSDWWACCPFHGEKTPSFHCENRKGRYHCFGCGASGDHFDFLMAVDGVSFPRAVEMVAELAGIRLPDECDERAEERCRREARRKKREQRRAADTERRQKGVVEERRKVQRLWGRRQPLPGTVGETYLRGPRGISCRLPPTLGFLPARNGHAPAVIAAFGFPEEIEPGVFAIADEAVRGIHLTRLQPDGSGKAAGLAKITIGGSKGFPIVLAPPNDLLGLVIAEGIEDALSAHQAIGLGAWAAGGAHRMLALANAVPSWIDCVTILVDDNEAGRENSTNLASGLMRRGIYCELTDAPGRAS